MSTQTTAAPRTRASRDEFPRIDGIHHVGLSVGDARQAAHFYRTALGFAPVASAGLETGQRDRVSMVLEQPNVWLVLTSALEPECDVATHVQQHGDSVQEIAFAVPDVEQAYTCAVDRGARALLEPTVVSDDDGSVTKAAVGGCGDIVHAFVQRNGYRGKFLPTYRPIADAPRPDLGVIGIDHIAFSVGKGELQVWAAFYEQVFGFHVSHREDVATEYSSMVSRVLQNDSGTIKFPMMEPADGRRTSQIEEYLRFHRGPGAQHVALLSRDIRATVRALRANGVEFLRTPAAYYDTLEQRVGAIAPDDVDELRGLGILVDRDREGLLLQVFTKPLQSRPTLFLEIVERRGSVGFGGGNIRALFEAVEREQAQRGTL